MCKIVREKEERMRMKERARQSEIYMLYRMTVKERARERKKRRKEEKLSGSHSISYHNRAVLLYIP